MYELVNLLPTDVVWENNFQSNEQGTRKWFANDWTALGDEKKQLMLDCENATLNFFYNTQALQHKE